MSAGLGLQRSEEGGLVLANSAFAPSPRGEIAAPPAPPSSLAAEVERARRLTPIMFDGVVDNGSLFAPIRLVLRGLGTADAFERFTPTSSRAAERRLEMVRTAKGAVGVWLDGELRAATAAGDVAQQPTVAGQIARAWLVGHEPSVLLHGSCIRLDGATIALLGLSGAGKSVLAAHMVARGGQYVADDIVPIVGEEPRCAVLRFAPGFKEPAWPVVASLLPEIADAPAFSRGAVRIKFAQDAPFANSDLVPAPTILAFPRFRSGARLRWVEIGDVEAYLRLSRCGLFVTSGGDETLRRTVSEARKIAFEYGDFADVERLTAEIARGGP